MLNGYTALVSGVFIARGKEDTIVTKNMVVGESVYGEKRISVEVSCRFRSLVYSQGCSPSYGCAVTVRQNDEFENGKAGNCLYAKDEINVPIALSAFTVLGTKVRDFGQTEKKPNRKKQESKKTKEPLCC